MIDLEVLLMEEVNVWDWEVFLISILVGLLVLIFWVKVFEFEEIDMIIRKREEFK